MNRNLSHLGMAKKAGLLAVGGEATATAARRGEAALIITASDASDGSVRRAKSNADINGVKYMSVPFTMFELGNVAGRGSPGTIAFLDKGLANGFIKRLSESENKIPNDNEADDVKESDA